MIACKIAPKREKRSSAPRTQQTAGGEGHSLLHGRLASRLLETARHSKIIKKSGHPKVAEVVFEREESPWDGSSPWCMRTACDWRWTDTWMDQAERWPCRRVQVTFTKIHFLKLYMCVFVCGYAHMYVGAHGGQSH